MKFSYKWLREFVELELSPEDLAGHLLLLGFEVSGISQRAPSLDGVVSAEILSIRKHPNADRLSLCEVTDGVAKLSVVCGATNIQVGQRVPLAKVGARLPGGRRIEKAKIRGTESQGMICSPAELGLADGPAVPLRGTDVLGDAALTPPPAAREGIHILPRETPVGMDVAGLLGPGDWVLETQITPNRPDCLSHYGLARELAVYFRLPLKPFPPSSPEGEPLPEGEALPVEILDREGCPRYMGRSFSGLSIGPSPAWLAERLEAVGLRSVSNLVDATNYVLFELGQPLHAFDQDLLEGGKIQVRRATSGERLKTLDGREVELGPQALVIADAAKPQALAGIIGGEGTGVGPKTTRAFLECAYFHPPTVRRTARALRIQTDSSYRFERGTDPEGLPRAMERATGLILAVCRSGDSKAAPKYSLARDVYPVKHQPPVIETSAVEIGSILGLRTPLQRIEDTLTLLAVKTGRAPDERIQIVPPSYRPDLKTPWDLAEDVGRLLGYDSIPSEVSPVKPRLPRTAPLEALCRRSREALSALGFSEAMNYDFLSAKELQECGWSSPQVSNLPKLANPLSEDWTYLRPSLVPGLLRSLALNLNRGAESVFLYEIGKCYAVHGREVGERTELSAVLCPGPKAGKTRSDSFEDAFLRAKLALERLLDGQVPRLEPSAAGAGTGAESLFHPKLTGSVGTFAAVGILHPLARRSLDLPDRAIALLRLDLAHVPEPRIKRFAPISSFPHSERDISFFLPVGAEFAHVREAILGAGVAELAQILLIDLFTGKGVPKGRKSMTVRLTFSRMDRTLKDSEIRDATKRVAGRLKKIGARIRE